MPRYGLVISSESGSVTQFDHDLGTFIRSYCQYNPAWTASSSDFDPVTGLPNDDALGTTDTSVPCSITASEQLFYLYDSYTCRILAFDPVSGSLFATFGGRRGIGAGKITLDATPRSICAVGNDKFWLVDNAGGFLVRYDLFGAFEAEFSISSWATALSLTFDQITGWAYDVARGRYWALAQDATSCYLFAVDTAGVATGEVINLTTRLASTLGLTIGGHNNSPADRVRTRGLFYRNGRLLLFANDNAIIVDLTNEDGDALVTTQVNDLSPGHWSTDASEITHVLRDQPNNAAVVYVRDGAGALLRSYGASFSPPDDVDGHIATPWDVTVWPTEEDAEARTSRTLSLRARITGTFTRALDMRAAIRTVTSRLLDMRARILNLGPFGSQRQITMRARIEEPTTLPDGYATAWTLEDSLGSFSRGLQLRCAGNPGLAVGDTLTLYAGYNGERVKVFHGEIDDVANSLTTESNLYTFSLRDVGALEANTRQVTYTAPTQFPRTTSDIPSATINQTLLDINAGRGGAPDYPMYGSFSVVNQTPIQILQKLTEPWNLFASHQYYPTVRDGDTFAREVNWRNPPSNGYRIPRSRLTSMTLKQTRYLQSPNLVGLSLQVKGATVTVAIQDQLGLQTKVEYMRSLAQDDVTSPSAGNTGVTGFAAQYVLTETTNVEEAWGDKVLSRTTEVYETRFSGSVGGGGAGSTKLISREEETTLYFEPPGDLGFDSIQTSSAGPSPLALPLQINSVASGIDPADGIFKELQRSQTNYYYDARFNLACESVSVTLFETSSQQWELDSVQQRFHSETTGGSTRIRRQSFTNDDGVLTFESADGQQVGGRRPAPAQSYASDVLTFQAVAPTPVVVVDVFGTHVAEIAAGAALWTYENPLLGQEDCEAVHGLASVEQGLQSNPAIRWESIDFSGIFDPNLQSGMAVQLEREPGVWEDYWLESVNHTWSPDEALSSGSAKRITTDSLPEE